MYFNFNNNIVTIIMRPKTQIFTFYRETKLLTLLQMLQELINLTKKYFLMCFRNFRPNSLHNLITFILYAEESWD